MRWSLFFCLLLASTAFARPRSKRSISHIKSLISKIIFGVDTKTIAQPFLSNNDNYQLFSIPGINDFLIKVKRNKKHEKDEKEMPKPVPSAPIVKPEIAIVGSYLGTKTQKETLLAIDLVRNLVGSGILTGSLDGSIHELLIPQPPIYVEEGIIEQPLPVIAKDQGHILVPEYPHLFVPPELKLTNADAKYSHKQTGSDADMAYESFDNKDLSQPLRINGPSASYYANQGMIAGNIRGPTQNSYHTYNDNQGMSGYLTGKEKNPYLSTYANQDLVSGHVAEIEKDPYLSRLVNHGKMFGNVTGKGQNPSAIYNVNQGMIYENVPGKLGNAPLLSNINSDTMTGHVPEKWQNPPTPYNSNQDSTTSGNVAVKEQSPLTINNVNQGITSVNVQGNGQNTPALNNNNHGMTSAENLTGIQPNSAYSVNQSTTVVNIPGKGQNRRPINNGLTLGIIPEQGQIFHHIFNDNHDITIGFLGKGQNPPSMYNAWTLGHLPGNAQIPPPFNVNQAMLPGYLPGVGHNPSYALYNGMSGNLPEYTQNRPPIFNVNHGVYGNVPGPLGNAPPMSSFNSGMIAGSVFGQLHHQGVMPGNIPGKEQHSSFVHNVNQGMTLEYVPGKGQNPPFTYNEGMSLGNVPGIGQYHPLTYNVNQGMTSGILPGTGHNSASYNFNQGAPVHNPTYYIHSGIVGQIPGHSSPGAQPYIGNNAGLIMTDRDPTLYPGPMSTVVSPHNFGNGHRVIVCKEKRLGKPCTHSTTPNLSTIETKSVVTQPNDVFGKAQNTILSEVLKNISDNRKTKSQYSYKQINHHSNKNFTEVKVGETTVINTNKNTNKDFVYIPPEDVKVSALGLQNEEGNGRGDTEAITSNLRTSEGIKKRIMTSNRVETNLSQHPIVVVKRSNLDGKETKAADLDEGEKQGDLNKEDIPGSTF